MPPEGPTSARRRLPRPPRALLLAALGLVICAGLGYGLYLALSAGDTEAAPAANAHQPSTDLARRGDGTSLLRDLRESLADARRGGRAPIAVATAPTGLRKAPGGRVLERLGTETEFGSPRVHAVVGRHRQWLEVMAAELPNGRTGWVSARDVDVEGVEYSLRATLGERTLEVRRRGRVVRRIEVAVGGPGTPTPTGTFAVTDKLRMTEASPSYGCCALAFTGHQPTVPQGWSGGDRLAVHGTPDEATVGHAVSLGCLRARKTDMRWLMSRVPLGTPVTVVRE